MANGKVHYYLGMTLNFRQEKKVQLTMYKFMSDMLKKIPREMAGVAVTPAADQLPKVSSEPKHLDKERAKLIHHLVAKCLFRVGGLDRTSTRQSPS